MIGDEQTGYCGNDTDGFAYYNKGNRELRCTEEGVWESSDSSNRPLMCTAEPCQPINKDDIPSATGIFCHDNPKILKGKNQAKIGNSILFLSSICPDTMVHLFILLSKIQIEGYVIPFSQEYSDSCQILIIEERKIKTYESNIAVLTLFYAESKSTYFTWREGGYRQPHPPTLE